MTNFSSSSSIHAEQAFYSYQADGAPSNSIDYVPMFFLLNRPPGEGRRDTGLACIEVTLKLNEIRNMYIFRPKLWMHLKIQFVEMHQAIQTIRLDQDKFNRC